MSDVRLAAPGRGFTPRDLLHAWRGITRQQVLVTFLLGCGMFLYRVIVTIDVRVAHFIFFADQLKAFVLLLVIVAIDQYTGRNPDRRGAYALGVVIGAAIAVPLSIVMMIGVVLVFTNSPSRFPGGIGFALNIYFEFVMVGGAAMWVINDRRRAARARVRMHRAELARIAAERRSIESELQAMQARIEPRFLFDTLGAARRLYERDALTGEALLDALIAYLRAAMPRSHGSSSTVSTVGTEVDLARAFLAITQLRGHGTLVFDVASPADEARRTGMPAMILLPLVDHALTMGAQSVRLHTSVTEHGTRFEITAAGVQADAVDGGERLADLRARLVDLFGAQGRLLVSPPRDGAFAMVLEFPLRA